MSSLSLPCLNDHVVKSNSYYSTRYKIQIKNKKFAMVSEPLLPVEDSDEQEIGTKDSEKCKSVLDKAVEADSEFVDEKESVPWPSSLEYCFLCSHSGPVIKEKICPDEKLKRHTKSQSLQVLNSSASNSASTPHLHVNLCVNMMGRRSPSASVLNSATLKAQQSSGSTIKDQSISSSLSKVTEVNDSCGLMCRICHSGDEEEELISPCRCTGTVKHAHQSCILNWVSKSGNQSCELCNFKFKTRKESVKCFWKWRFPEVSTKGWLHIGLFIAFVTMLLTSITWITWSRVSRTPTAMVERTTEEVKFAYMVNGLFIALAVGGLYFDSLKRFKQYSKRWAALNRNVVVECYTLEQSSEVGVKLQHSTCTPNELPSSDSMADEETQAACGSSQRHEPADWV